MRATFSLVTSEAVYGQFDKIELKADKFPGLRGGMEEWCLRYLFKGNVIHSRTVKCSTANGYSEALAILAEAAPYYNRKTTH